MRKISAILSLLALLSIPLGVWITVEGNPIHYLTHPVPDGQAFYIFSKLIGLYAFILLWLHVMWVILKNTSAGNVLPKWRRQYHQVMGVSLVGVIVVHIALFVTAVSLRKEAFAYNLLFPNFSDYYHSLLGLGVLALWLLPLIIYTGFKLKHDSTQRWLHRAAFLVFTLIFFHGIGVGSETKSGLMLYLYLFMGGSVVVALLLRIIRKTGKQNDAKGCFNS